MAFRGKIALLTLVLLSACDNCRGGGVPGGGGDTPHLRCLMGEPPAGKHWRVGKLTLAIEGRTLEMKGIPVPARVVAFSGPAFGPPPDAALLGRLTAAGPAFAVLLGGVGDDRKAVSGNLSALAELAFPTLLLAGGRDNPEWIAAALAALPEGADRVVDVTAMRRVRTEAAEFIPVAGSGDGRYALTRDSCGFELEDLKAVAAELGTAADRPRWLLSWEAPGLGGALSVARTDEGLDVGNPDLAELARRVGAPGGLFAWPSVQGMRPRSGDGRRSLSPGATVSGMRLVVPRLTGPPQERDDGSSVEAGFALLELGPHGMRLMDPETPPKPSEDSSKE